MQIGRWHLEALVTFASSHCPEQLWVYTERAAKFYVSKVDALVSLYPVPIRPSWSRQTSSE
jgi:hypothetical protein